MKAHKVTVGKLHFSSAHFLVSDEFGVEAIHGHNFGVEVTIEQSINPDGIVIDFVKLRQLCIKVVMDLDHKLLLPTRNPDLTIEKDGDKYSISAEDLSLTLKESVVCELPFVNVSAELLAEFIGQSILEKLRQINLVNKSGVMKVKVTEEPGCTGTCKFQF